MIIVKCYFPNIRYVLISFCIGLFLILGSSVGWADSNKEYEKGLMAVKGKNYKTAIRIFKQLAEAGHTEAQFDLAWFYHQGVGVSEDHKEESKWMRKAAEQGNPKAQFGLGIMYQNGNPISQDFKEAARWHHKAAAQGNVMAMFNLGLLYLDGKGVEHDLKKARQLIIQAAEQGYGPATKLIESLKNAEKTKP